jgi:glucose/arabinose dehydrogenase
MKPNYWLMLLAVVVTAGAGWWFRMTHTPAPTAPASLVLDEVALPAVTTPTETNGETLLDIPLATIVAENLNIPWEVLFLPDGEILVTERPGKVVLLRSGREIEVPGIQHIGEGGLLGAALPPDFATNRVLYLYQTTADGDELTNQIVRYRLIDGELTFDQVIIDDLPGARFHDGGRIAFGPDGYLYATVGDALRPNEAANPNSLEGTIIRLTADGAPAPGNPFGTAVYSYGHRNAQGLTWDGAGNFWSTEHGRSGLRSGFDEVNLITAGANYGWPESEGDAVAAGTEGPRRHSGPDVTWAPAGAAYLDGSLYFTGLRGETLYEAVLDGTKIVSWYEHLVREYGRLRTVTVGPDNMLYVTTSNRDGRGDAPAPNDDLLLRINPTKLNR